MIFTDKQLDRYADVLMWGLETARKHRFKKKDIVLIRYHNAALPLAEKLYARVIASGRHPIQRMVLTDVMEKDFYQKADPGQLTFQPAGSETFYQHLNGSIYLHAPNAITHLRGVDPDRIGKTVKSRKNLKDILDRREETGDFGWTLCMYPTPEPAEQAEMTIKAYAGQIIKACYLNRKDPVGHWKTVFKQSRKIKKWLNSLPIDTLRVESANMDLTVTLGKQRKWLGVSGHNIPSFEIFTSPDFHGTRGVYFADLPSYRSGNRIENARIEFKGGGAVSVSADAGEDFIRKQLTIDNAACRVGEFSLTDKRFSKINKFMANTLFDENYGGAWGNCHIALGAAYMDTFDGDAGKLTKNQRKRLGFNDSALHWDLVNTEKKRVAARLTDGKKITIYENGIFNY